MISDGFHQGRTGETNVATASRTCYGNAPGATAGSYGWYLWSDQRDEAITKRLMPPYTRGLVQGP